MMTRNRLGQGDSGMAYLGGAVGDTGSTSDTGAVYCGPRQQADTEYAAIEFENMIREAKRDGVITQDEAIELTTKHWILQEKSRRALKDLLQSYGFKDVVLNGDPGTTAAKLAEYINHLAKPRKLPLPQVTDHKKSTHFIDWNKIKLPEPDVDYHKKGANFIQGKHKIPQKVTWLSIVGPAALVSLLGVLGVI